MPLKWNPSENLWTTCSCTRNPLPVNHLLFCRKPIQRPPRTACSCSDQGSPRIGSPKGQKKGKGIDWGIQAVLKAVCCQTAWEICAGVEALRGKLAGIPRDLQVLVESAVISTCLEILGLPIGELVGASRDPQVLWKAFCHQSGVRLHSCGKLKVSLGISYQVSSQILETTVSTGTFSIKLGVGILSITFKNNKIPF